MKRPFVYAVVCGLSLLAPLGCSDETKKETKTTTTTHTDSTKTKGSDPPKTP